jgi:hypothetical protein
MATGEERNNSILREMERTSLDLIRIYNPTSEDFVIIWDGFKHVVPHKGKDVGYGLGMRVVQRYLAEWYKKHMTDKMINEMQDAKLGELKEKYEKAGVEDGVLKAHLDVERNRGLRTDNEPEVARIANIIWLGIEERFGLDDRVEQVDEKIDKLSVHEKVSEALKNKVYKRPEVKKTWLDAEVPVVEKPKEQVYPISQAKKKLETEVTKE